ncbi:FkbM family methyltransferase [Methylobacterium sp. ID0610]|uniref:FkbM family methyltransferase n=1 Tax=Methylobacterium carpenticola TaxID=3344827 RepID=UPI00368790D5
MSDLVGTRAGEIMAMSERALAARPWRQPGYRYRPMSIHDRACAQFWSQYPYAGWVHVQVDDVVVAMFMANDDGVALIYNAFGPDSYEAASVAAWVALARECRQIADIGAFTGLYTLLAHKASGEARVVTVEPNSASRARLYNNMVWNGCDRSRVVPYAVSAEIGTLPLFVPMGADLLDTGASLNRSGAVSRTEIVACAPVDAIMAQAGVTEPDLMKIDVEGLEEEALRGMSLCLRARPTLFLEVASAELLQRCHALLAPHGYRMWGIDDEGLTMTPPVEAEGIPGWFAQHGANRGALNYLCCAREDHLVLARRGIDRVHALL